MKRALSAYRPLSLHRITVIVVVLLALSLASREALMQALRSAPVYVASESQTSASRSQSDAGGQTASPNPSGGFDQEERVRRLLAQEYEQRLGTTDEAIRSVLGLRGKVADFVGYNARTNRWLIAESKTSDIDTAVKQLQNTTQALLRMQPGAKVELRLFLDAKNFELLKSGSEVYGWRMSAQGYLGWIDSGTNQWVEAVIEGIKIGVQCVP